MSKARLTPRDAAHGPAALGGYAQAMQVEGAQRILFVSGQIPVDAEGHAPQDFEAQCRQAWANVVAQLDAADLDLDDVVKVTTYLADRRYGEVNGRVRREILGSRRPALTVVIAAIYDEAWLLEIEVVAAR